MRKLFGSLADLLWVLQAFLRGKVLRQKAYQLQAGLAKLPVAVSVRRMTMLMRWWGLRPATPEELWASTVQQQQKHVAALPPTRVPYLNWDDSEFRLGQEWDDRSYHRFPTQK